MADTTHFFGDDCQPPHLMDCPCCTELTHPEDFRTVNGRRYCAWCDENGCPQNVPLSDEGDCYCGPNGGPHRHVKQSDDTDGMAQ